jgi:hypothetical protein
MNNNFFYLENIPKSRKYMIKCNREKIEKKEYELPEVACARLFGITYTEWLYFCVNVCGAEIVEDIYPYPVFEKDPLLDLLLKILNQRGEAVATFLEEKKC